MQVSVDNVETIFRHARVPMAGALPECAQGEQPFAFVPDGFAIKKLEEHLPAPSRKRGKVHLTDSRSFVSYVNKHGCKDHTVIYADVDAEAGRCKLVGILNDHGPSRDIAGDGATWRDHLASYDPKKTVEWERWIKNDKATMGQVEFAAFVEDNMKDIAGGDGMPTGADMLQMALTFQSIGDKKFSSSTNLQSGSVRFEFIDDEDKDTKKSMEAFSRFRIGLKVFDTEGDQGYAIEARLRYRVKESRLVLWYELIRPDLQYAQAVNDELTKIKTGTGFLVLNGKSDAYDKGREA